MTNNQMLFSFNSRQLWSDDANIDANIDDEDYTPYKSYKPYNTYTPSDNSNVNVNVVNVDNNVVNDDSIRIVKPIKIIKSKMINQTNANNWSIVSEKNTNTGSVEVRKTGGKRGRKKGTQSMSKNGFIVTNGKKVYHQKQQQQHANTSASNVSLNNMDSSYEFSCLLSENNEDFEQILPKEILIRLFSYVLDDSKDRMQTIINLSLVCESWRNIIISAPLLWQCLDLHSFKDESTVRNGFNVLCDQHLFSNVRYLNLNGWNGVYAEQVLQNIALNSTTHLRQISLKNCRNISAKILHTITQYCPNIEFLDFSAITEAAHQNSQSPFASPIFRPFIETHGIKLSTLNLSENTMPSFSSCISTIMDFCANIRVLDISNVESLSKTASIGVERLQNCCPHLRVLRAANITFTSSSLQSSPGFVCLRELSIPSSADSSLPIFINAHTDAVFEQLTKCAEKLKLLDIRGARYLTARALVKIPAWNVQHLSISNCPKLQSEQLEMAFTKWNKSLIDVDLSWNICESSVTACLRSLYEIGSESQLRSIQLRGSAVAYDELKKLVTRCAKLESIDLQSCRGLPRGIKRSYRDEEFQLIKNDIIFGKYD